MPSKPVAIAAVSAAALVTLGVGVAVSPGARTAEPRAAAVSGAMPLRAAAPAPAAAPVPVEGVPAGGPLQAQAAAVVSNPEDWSILAWSLDRDAPLFSIHPEEVRVPASNNKVFSSVWALALLGPDHRFETTLLAAGPVEGGVLRGDLVLQGSGDPAFGYPEFEKEPLDAVRGMARSLAERGVRSVQGGIVADTARFGAQAYGPDWPNDTGNGAAYYAPGVSGIPFQRNVVWVETTPGEGPGYRLRPDVPEIPVKLEGGGGRGYAVRKPGEDTIRIRGALARNARYAVGVNRPELLAAGALREALREVGIQVAGPVRAGLTPEGAEVIHRRLSMPLGDMLPKLNRDSDNFFAEHVWKAAVAESAERGTYAAGGPASAVFFHRMAGVPYGQIWQADGSGLSSQNHASAWALVRALAYADEQPWGEVLHRSMAVAGAREGTLRRMFNGGAANGNLHAKTGYIRQVRTLAGYVTTRSGERVAFAFLYNGANTNGARAVQQRLGELLAEYGD